MAVAAAPPFQYALRGAAVADDPTTAQAHEQRDRDLEDYLGRLSAWVGYPAAPSAPRLAPTAWTALPFTDVGWAAAGGYQAPQYRLSGDMVQLRGTAARTPATDANTTMATLPPGFRPAALCSFAAQGYQCILRFDIAPTGVVSHPVGYGLGAALVFNYLNLDGVFFSIAP